MPAKIRNLKNCGVDEFKIELDQFIAQIPDQTVIGKLVPTICDPITMKPTNSILDWAPIQKEFGVLVLKWAEPKPFF